MQYVAAFASGAGSFLDGYSAILFLRLASFLSLPDALTAPLTPALGSTAAATSSLSVAAAARTYASAGSGALPFRACSISIRHCSYLLSCVF